MAGKVRKKRLISFGIAAITIIAVLVIEDLKVSLLNAVKRSLDYQQLYIIIMALSLLVGLYYTFYYAKNSYQKDLKYLFKVFGPLFDPPANTLVYGIVLASVLTLARGLFNQFFFDIEYFKDFSLINVSALALSCIPLVIWSVKGLSQFIVEIFVEDDEDKGIVTPIKDKV